MKRSRFLPALAIAAALVAVTPAIPAMAAPSETVRVVPAACGYKTEYRWQDFSCWMLFGGRPPSRCYYRVYSCS